MVSYLVVALDSIHEGLVSHDLGFPVEESLEAVLDGLQLLFADLEETERGRVSTCSIQRSWDFTLRPVGVQVRAEC